MEGAIFFTSSYGSTKQYATWISEATGLPIFDVKKDRSNPSAYDFLIIGSPIIYFKLTIHKWIKRHLAKIENKPTILFSVSGAPAGKKLEGWIVNCLPKDFFPRVNYVALRGRQIPKELSFYDRMMLIIGSKFNKDPEARKQELEGFDFMDKTSIEPILKLVDQIQSGALK